MLGLPLLAFTALAFSTASAEDQTASKNKSQRGNKSIPIFTDMSKHCTQLAYVKPTDHCADVLIATGVLMEDLYKMNPSVGSNCETMQGDTWLCVSTKSINKMSLKNGAEPSPGMCADQSVCKCPGDGQKPVDGVPS